MFNKIQNFFEPLDVSYCNYFYFSSVFGFVFMVIISLALLVNLMNYGKKVNSLGFVSLIMQGFLTYFLNRLLYSMCIKSL